MKTIGLDGRTLQTLRRIFSNYPGIQQGAKKYFESIPKNKLELFLLISKFLLPKAIAGYALDRHSN